MPEKLMLYNIIYALAAKDGREGALFGTCAPLAQDVFPRSFVGPEFPELWYEIPLAGNPWFDLHALTSREALDGLEGDALFEGHAHTFHPEVFKWFARQPGGVRQLAISHDLGRGCVDDPAVQLLVSTSDAEVTCSFLEAAGRPDAADAYRAFRERMPQGWFACYTGVFPDRPEIGLRVECIPDSVLQRSYASDGGLLERHLLQTGLAGLGDTVVPHCLELARTPFNLEFQFDIAPDGTARPMLGASLRFACPPGEPDWSPFEAAGAGGELMRLIESWGLADERWKLFDDVMFAKRLRNQDEEMTLFSYPAFVKLRWKDGEPLDAKAYLIAGVQA